MNSKLLFACGVLTLTAASQAQTLFSNGAESLNDFSVITQSADNSAIVVDYSAFNEAGGFWSLPEAPRQIAGSSNSMGILMRANFDSVAAATGQNLVLGGTPLEITAAQYTLSFDMFMKAPDPATVAGSTEQSIWGVGRANSTSYIGRNTRTTNGSGTWGWAAGEGGYGTEDFAAYQGTTLFGNKQNTGAEAQAAFAGYEWSGAPSGDWVTVDVVVDNGNVQVFYNSVLFWDISNAQTSGFAMVGYEDSFNSISAEPQNTWMVIDNVTLEAVPEPMTLTLLGAGALALLRKRKQA